MSSLKTTVSLIVCFIPIMLTGQWNSVNYFNKSYDFQYVADIVEKLVVTDSEYLMIGSSGWPNARLLLVDVDSAGNIVCDQ